MITWVRLWPLLLSPLLVISFLSVIPVFTVRDHILGGGVFVEWLLNRILLPLLPWEQGNQLVQWFSGASYGQELMLALLMALNITALIMPVLYGLGELVIWLTAFFTRKELELKRQSMR
ncbi:MAG: hypothetical protein ABUK13_09075 [Gammaproteobacteria bacterium]